MFASSSILFTLAGYFVVDDLTRAFVGADKIAYQNPNNFMKVAASFRWFLAEARDDFSRPIRGEMVRWSSNLKKLKILEKILPLVLDLDCDLILIIL